MAQPLVRVEYCAYCQCAIIPGCEDLYEVNVGGLMTTLCKPCFREWDANKFGEKDTLPALHRPLTLAHAV